VNRTLWRWAANPIWIRAALFAAIFAAILCASPSEAQSIDAETLSAANEGAVLLVIGDKAGEVVQGSGCCIDSQGGLVLTTAHQVEGITNMRALTRDGEAYQLELLELDSARDIALLQADRPLPQEARIDSANGLRNGASVLSISSPKGIAFSTYTGTVTNVDYERNGHPVILTDLPLTPGASGGPVFDRDGALIGIVSGNVTEVENTVVVPIDSAIPMICAHSTALALCDAASREEPSLAAAPGAPEAERRAVAAYNAGVEADEPHEKVTRYQQAVAHLPAFYEAWFNLAVAYTALDDFPAAAAAYEKAIDQDPSAPRARRNLGLLYLRHGRIPDSLAQLRKAVELAPDDERAHNDLGEAYRRSNRLEQAAATFVKALDLKEDYAVARYNLALTYAQLGRAPEAVESFKRYLVLAPGADDAAQVREWIEKLEAGER
jgi:tetratricopeptide (TPR) repeat protein